MPCLHPGERDDAWPGDDLMDFFQLKRLYDFSMRALEKPSAYLKGVPGDTTLYKCALPTGATLYHFTVAVYTTQL